ncbi:MAG: MATE family efflux transporter [Lachnospiraceae bacterium]|nr:MATE family efflux transporter [Lachnospiraceae bacterium]
MELDMTKGSPFKLILKFIYPVILGNLFQQLYNMADTIIVGRFVGLDALAAVGATGTIFFLILGFMNGLTAGFTVIVAQKYGAGDRDGVKVASLNAMILAAVTTVVVTLIAALGMPGLLRIMHTPDDIFHMSYSYIIIIVEGLAFTVLYNITASLLRAVGNSKTPLYFLILSASLNIILDIVLIVPFGLGVRGAALATIISQAVSGVLCVVYIFKKVKVLVPGKEQLHVDRQIMGNQVKIGLPMALQYSITAVGTIMVQSALNLFGSTVVASYTASNKVTQLITTPYGAMGVTMATYCAQNRGINDINRIRKGVKASMIMSAIFSLLIYALSVPLLPVLLKLFVDTNGAVPFNDVLSYAKTYVYTAGSCYIPLGIIFIFRNAMQGCGFSLAAMTGGIVELVCRGIISVIAAHRMSFFGVCLGDPLTWLITAIFFTVMYILTVDHMDKSKKAYHARRKAEEEAGKTAKIR